MSLLNRELIKLIKDKIEFKDSILSLKIQFDKNFIGFQGHFPYNPVLPGIIMIKIMTSMYELFNKKKYSLSQIKQVKFIEPVLVDNTIFFSINSVKDKDNIKLNGKVLKSEKVISKISLILQEQ